MKVSFSNKKNGRLDYQVLQNKPKLQYMCVHLCVYVCMCVCRKLMRVPMYWCKNIKSIISYLSNFVIAFIFCLYFSYWIKFTLWNLNYDGIFVVFNQKKKKRRKHKSVSFSQNPTVVLPEIRNDFQNNIK